MFTLNDLFAVLHRTGGYAPTGTVEPAVQSVIRELVPSTFTSDFIVQFGNDLDGVLEFIGSIGDANHFETGYYFGAVKPRSIVNVSPQVGCPAACKFCELGGTGFAGHLEPVALVEQVAFMLRLAFERGLPGAAGSHKVNIAKSGDILFHPRALEVVEALAAFGFRMKLSSVFPRGQASLQRFQQIAMFASAYSAPIQWQISLISTDETERRNTAGPSVASFEEIRTAGELWRRVCPRGRKINLSLILHRDSIRAPAHVRRTFPPEFFRFRFRPYIPTENGAENGLTGLSNEQLSETREQFAEAGYDVDDWATPTPTERRFGLSSNSTLELYRSRLLRAQKG